MAAEVVGGSIVSGVASKVAESSFDPIKRQISYVFKYQRYLDDLKNRVKELQHRREMVEQPVQSARGQGDEIYKGVEDWLSTVNQFTREVVQPIIEDENEAKKLCFKGICPNFFMRYNLSKKAVKAAKDATDLLSKGNFSNVSYRSRPERIEFKNAVRDYQQFESRMKVFQDVMEALADSKVNMIGVHGMGGVGKTSLAKLVAKKVLEEKLIFNEVVMAEVTRDPDVKKIQEKIASDLGLQFDANNRADRLYGRLKKEKSVLVVLDDLWAELDLGAIGIPFGDDEKEREDGQRRCTVLLTSRNLQTLNNMGCRPTFLIEALNHSEAMSLFWNSLGDDSTLTSEFLTLAVNIVGKCGGLPIAVKTIAGTLKNEALRGWKNAWNYLKKFNPRRIYQMDSAVYSPIELSYEFLKEKEAKSLFLLCGLLNDGSDITINDLMRCGMGLGMFSCVDDMEEARNRLYTLIGTLKDICFLLDGDTENDVKMHDIIHDVAISVAAKEHMFNIRNVVGSNQGLNDAIQEDTNAISLPYRDIRELPERLNCPKLEFFLLSAGNVNSLQFPNRFFEETKELKVLHLTGIRFSSLPSSLGCLVNLQTLSLINCYDLKDVAIVGDELKKLAILSLHGSGIEHLPVQIGQLTRLRVLDLGNCEGLVGIPPQVISNLSQLEELYLDNGFTKWEKVGGGSNSDLAELEKLSELTTLEIHIPDVTVMPPKLLSVDLKRFNISIGERESLRQSYLDMWCSDEVKPSRTLKFNGLDKNIYVEKEMETLLKKSEGLYLFKLNDFQNIVHELDKEGFPQLKHLKLQNCPKILCIVDLVRQACCNVFPLLKSLVLRNLINLEKICYGQLSNDHSFGELKIIRVSNCDKLQHLFSFSMAKNLLQLQEMDVTDCKKLKLIVGEERENHNVHENERTNDFPQLHSLRLRKLPQLTTWGFHVEVSQAATSSTSKEIVAEDDPKDLITLLFPIKATFPALKNLELSFLDIEQIWLVTISTSPFPNLTKLEVTHCSRLKFLFSYSMVNSFLQLQKLVIEWCGSMECVIDTTGFGNEEGTNKVVDLPKLKTIHQVFPQLTSLRLLGLQNLKSIYQGTHILEWTALEDLNVSFCDEVETLFGSSGLLSKETKNQQSVFLIDHSKVAFPNLKNLDIEGCDGLRNLTTLSTVESIVKLARMKIRSCNIIEEIIQRPGEAKQESPIVFNQLVYLELDNLSRLEHFCVGNFTLEFPFLEQVVVSQCLNMKNFFQGSLLTPNLQKVQLIKNYGQENEEWWKGNLNSTIQKIFEEMDGFKSLTELILSEVSRVKEIWHDQTLPVSFFSNLRILIVDDCTLMSVAIPATLIRFLNNLDNLEVTNCDSVEEVFHLEELNSDQHVRPLFPKLHMLNLKNLPKLKRFCNLDGIMFGELSYLSIDNCPNMEAFISNSTQVDMEPQEMTSEKNFMANDIQPFFDEKVGFPNLKTLWISRMSKLRKIWSPQLVEGRFDRLVYLSVWNCDSIEVIIEEETSSQSTVDEKFPLASTKLQMFPQLTSLHVWGLPKLKSIYQGTRLLEWTALENLKVFRCDKVQILFGSSESLSGETKNQQPMFLIDHSKVAFPNLKNLDIEGCDGLRNLTTLSTVESIVKLARIEIRYCNMIEEIIQQIGEVKEESPVVFNQLVYLELHSLPRLEHFCVGNFTLKFPYLEKAVVSGCISMKIFSQGNLLTPNLQKVQLTNNFEEENEKRWEGSLNFTIQKIFEEMAGLCGLNRLMLSQVPHVKDIWHDRTLPVSFFSNLNKLVVDDCTLMSTAIPSNLIQFLDNLRDLKVTNCDSVEEVLRLEELNADQHVRPLFPALGVLNLINLPKLKRFCNFNGIMFGKFFSLSIEIENCPNMKTFISNSTQVDITANMEPQEMTLEKNFVAADIQPFFDEKVSFLKLRKLRLSKLPKLEQLVPSSVSFQHLWGLEVSNCKRLKNLLTISTTKSLVSLEEMKIIDCKMIEKVIELEIEEEVKEDLIIFKQLKYLELNCLPSLVSFYLGNYTLEFPVLEKIIVRECPKIKTFSQGVLISPKLQKVQETELEDEGRWEGNLNFTIQKLFEEMS